MNLLPLKWSRLLALIGIVEFLGEISGVVSKKNGAGVFNGPDDSVGGTVGGDARSRPGISKN